MKPFWAQGYPPYRPDKEQGDFGWGGAILALLILLIAIVVLSMARCKQTVKYDEQGKWIRCPSIKAYDRKTGDRIEDPECWWLAEPAELNGE